nr:MFS transporter [Naasia lichenicola]
MASVWCAGDGADNQASAARRGARILALSLRVIYVGPSAQKYAMSAHFLISGELAAAVERREQGGIRMDRYAGALRFYDFRLLITSSFINSIGSWVAQVVLDVYVYSVTGSLGWLAAMAAAGWIPGLLIAPLAGVLADRVDRRTLMVVSALLSGVVGLAVVGIVISGGPVIVILVLTIVASIVRSPYGPAAGALTPEVVDEENLPTANSLYAGLDNIVIVIGPAIGGLLVLIGEPAIGVSINAISYFAAAALALGLRVRSRGDAAPGERLVRQVLDGVGALRRTPTAAVLLLFAALDTMLCGAYTVIYIPISQHLGMGNQGYGYLLAGMAVGGIIGAVVADRLSGARRLAPIIVGGVLVQAIPYALTAFTNVAAVGIGLQLLSGIGMVIVDVVALTAIQREVSAGLLSRVLSLQDTAALLASVIGSIGAAALLSSISIETALIAMGVGFSAVALALSPLLLRVDRASAARTTLLDHRVRLLEAIRLFAPSSRTVKERLASAMQVAHLAPGDLLIREGDDADALWVLAEGRLSVTSSTAAGIPDVSAPDVVGEIGVLTSIPRTATVVAATSAIVWRLSAEDFVAAVEPQRQPLLLLGPSMVRLRRTHPDLVRAEA